MKRLSFQYHLKISMDAPVSRHCFTLRLTPESDERQRIEQLQQNIFPCDYLRNSRDEWGNSLLYGSFHDTHSIFEADVNGQALTGLAEGVPVKEPEKERIFQYATPLTRPDDALLRFSAGLGPHSGSEEEILSVMRAVHDALNYEPGVTNTKTTAAEAFVMGRGVCQDYAHVMLAVLRSRGIPARYAAGMLLGEGASHAWVEALHNGIWVGYDPTNCLVVSDEHILLARGRDAQDCAINRGIFRGYASQTTEISVIVTEL